MEYADPIKAQLAAEHLDCIGYDPFADDPATTVEEIRETLRDWHQERLRQERAFRIAMNAEAEARRARSGGL